MAIPANLEEFQNTWRKFEERRGFDDIAATLGMTPAAADGESLTMTMALTDPIAQANGMYSAAALFGAADIVGTFTAMTAYAEAGQFPLAVQSNINLISNSKTETVSATAKILRAGRSLVVTEVQVHDEAGKLLTNTTFTYMLSEKKLGNK
ncbi:PaaI family thioesterase [Micrococcoides hystricis]|uniref:PaaI family thioesterase n=1 Tax=Micrococcoides hystricis TaxID=1572761 RepID=A0ABV6PBA2_9MICC